MPLASYATPMPALPGTVFAPRNPGARTRILGTGPGLAVARGMPGCPGPATRVSGRPQPVVWPATRLPPAVHNPSYLHAKLDPRRSYLTRARVRGKLEADRGPQPQPERPNVKEIHPDPEAAQKKTPTKVHAPNAHRPDATACGRPALRPTTSNPDSVSCAGCLRANNWAWPGRN